MLKLFIHLPQNNAKFIQHLLHYTFFKRETVGRQTELNLQDFKVKRTKKKIISHALEQCKKNSSFVSMPQLYALTCSNDASKKKTPRY